MEIKFTVMGEPKGKARPRVVNVHGHSMAYTPKDTATYENLIRVEYGLQTGNYRFPDGTPLAMTIWAYMGIPKSASKKRRQLMAEGLIRPTKKPDVDNICKVVADSINGIAYRGDSAIVIATIYKLYAEQPRLEVELKEF